jgi:hypothetical protein
MEVKELECATFGAYEDHQMNLFQVFFKDFFSYI